MKIIAMLMIVFIHVIGKGMFRYEANNVEFYKIAQFIIIPSTAIVIFLICLLIEKITKNTIQKFICNKLEKIYLAINKRVKNIRKFKYEISNE